MASRPEWQVCGEATTGREAVKRVEELKPDVVVLDAFMPELNGVEAARQILKLRPSTRLLILSSDDSDDLIPAILGTGTLGYVVKSDGGDILISAIEAVGKGRLYLTSRASEVVLHGYLAETVSTGIKGSHCRRFGGSQV